MHAFLSADSKAEPEGPSDQLLLWAVEGLAGVVINGIPNNVPGTRALNTPKAMLWGQHDSQLTWPGECFLSFCSDIHLVSEPWTTWKFYAMLQTVEQSIHQHVTLLLHC